MEGGRTMGEERGNMEENLRVKMIRRFWGLRPWKRHSTILRVVGILYAVIGYQYIVADPNPARERSLIAILQFAPIQFWGVVFFASGILTSISSRWPPFSSTWGYMMLTGLSAAWSASYLIGWMFYHSPSTNVSGVIVWGLLAFVWWAISGLLNPDSTPVASHGSD
jgi:ascorbate-specific PTS system EIIC-type component UlaA